MRNSIPILIYLSISFVLLIMALYRVSGYLEGFTIMNLIFFSFYFVKALVKLIKHKFNNLDSYFLMFAAFTFIFVLFKLNFKYYNFDFHVIYSIGLTSVIFISVIKGKSYNRNVFMATLFVFINLLALFIDDYTIFKLWNNDKIAWSDEKLSWQDYKMGVPEDDLNVNAITMNGLQWKVSKVNNRPSVLVIGFMKPSESWVKNEFKSNFQLRHEQLYLDICELHARKIRKTFKEAEVAQAKFGLFGLTKDEAIDSLKREIWNVEEAEELIRRIEAEKRIMNNKYMMETAHGQNDEKQIIWEKIVQSELNTLADYKK